MPFTAEAVPCGRSTAGRVIGWARNPVAPRLCLLADAVVRMRGALTDTQPLADPCPA